MDLGGILGGAASTFGKGGSLSHENRESPSWFNILAPGTGGKKSPVMDEFGNFYRIQDEYEDERQRNQQGQMNQLTLAMERASFNQKMQLAKEHGLHPLSVLGVPMSSSVVGATSHESNQPVAGTVDFSKHQTPEVSEHDKRMMEYNERIADANARAAESRAVSDELEARQRASVLLGQQVGSNRISNDQIATQSKLSGVPYKSIEGSNPIIRIKPAETTATAPGNPNVTAAISPALDRVLIDGKPYYIPSQEKMQVDMEGGELIATLMNYGGLPLDAAIATTALLPIVGPAVAGLGYAAHRGYRAYRIGKEAARIAKMASRKSWKK